MAANSTSARDAQTPHAGAGPHDPSAIAALLATHADMMACFAAVASLALPDAWIGAGFVRNAVWSARHGQPIPYAALTDIDVVYFDPNHATAARDAEIERALRARLDAPWQVRNQARMRVTNGNSPYLDTADAMRHWPETATAVAARLREGQVELLAPFGVDDLLALIVRPTPAFAARPEVVARRAHEKRWLERWPRLHVVLG